MARVPLLTPQVRQRADGTPFQTAAGASGAAFGVLQANAQASTGRAVAGVGDQLASAALKTQAEDNEREAKRKEVEYQAAAREATKDYFASKSNNAVDGYDAVEKRLADAKRSVMEGVENPRVRAMLEGVIATREESYRGKIDGHYAAERRVANDEASEARKGQALDEVAAFPTDAEAIKRARAVFTAENRDMAERNGWTPEVAKGKLEADLSAMHTTAIDALIDRDAMAAREYYREHENEIDGRVRPDLEKKLEAGELRQQSQQATDDILSRGLGERDALAQARKIKDPKLRDEVVERVGKRYAENERIETRARRDASDAAWLHVRDGGSVDDLSANQLAALPQGAYNSMREFERKRAKDGRGFADATDPAAYNAIHRAYMDDRIAFAEMDLNQYIGKLDESDYQYWLGQQRTVDRKAEADAAKAASYTLADRIAKEYMNAAGIDPTPKDGTKDAARVQKVYSLIRQTVDDFHAQGKRPTREDIEGRLKELFLVGDTGKTFMGFGPGGANRPFFEVLGTNDEGKFELEDIEDQAQRIADVAGVPVANVPAMAEALRAKKLPVTIDNLKALHQLSASGTQ